VLVRQLSYCVGQVCSIIINEFGL